METVKQPPTRVQEYSTNDGANGRGRADQPVRTASQRALAARAGGATKCDVGRATPRHKSGGANARLCTRPLLRPWQSVYWSRNNHVHGLPDRGPPAGPIAEWEAFWRRLQRLDVLLLTTILQLSPLATRKPPTKNNLTHAATDADAGGHGSGCEHLGAR